MFRAYDTIYIGGHCVFKGWVCFIADIRKMTFRDKGQISMEYILITGFSLLIAIPLVVIFFTNSASFNESVVNSQAKTVLEEMMSAAQAVHYLGEPSQKTISVYFPKYVEEVIFEDGYFGFLINQGGISYGVYKHAQINFTGNLSTYPGLHKIRVSAINNTVDFSVPG